MSTSLAAFLDRLTVQELEHELAEIDGELRALEARRGLIQFAIELKQIGGGPRAEDAVDGVRPSLRKGLLQIMAGRPGNWTKQQLFEEVKKRGWVPEGQTPQNQMAARLSSMVKRGEVQRVGPGVYRISAKGLID